MSTEILFSMSLYEQQLRAAYDSGYDFLVEYPLTLTSYQDYSKQGFIVENKEVEFYYSKSKQSLGRTIEEVETLTDGIPIEIIKHPRFSYPVMHNHSYIEMIYLYKGSCKHFIEDKEVILKEGDICILSPNTFHALSVADVETIVVNILISKKFFQTEVLDMLKSNEKNTLSSFIKHVLFGQRVSPYLVMNTAGNQKIQDNILAMFMEREKKQFKYDILLRLLLQQLFIEIVRGYDSLIQLAPGVDQDYNELCEAILAYISLNYNKTNLKETAKFFGYDPKYLGQKVRKYTGKSFNDLLSELQVEHAKNLILTTNRSIADICQEVGCFDASHLTKKFKKIDGKSPLQYRKEMNQ